MLCVVWHSQPQSPTELDHLIVSVPHLTPNLYSKCLLKNMKSHIFLTLKIEHRWTFTSSAMHYYTSTLLTDSKLLPSATNTIVAEDFNFLFLNNKGYQLSHRRHSYICVLNLWCQMMLCSVTKSWVQFLNNAACLPANCGHSWQQFGFFGRWQ